MVKKWLQQEQTIVVTTVCMCVWCGAEDNTGVAEWAVQTTGGETGCRMCCTTRRIEPIFCNKCKWSITFKKLYENLKVGKILNFYMSLEVKVHIELKPEKYHSLLDAFILCPLHFADN